MDQRGGTRTKKVMLTIRGRIASGVLGPGSRLPSVRSFAETMNVSPSTVVEAYDRLAAEGVIRARRGSGFYVIGGNTPLLSVGELDSVRDQAIDPFWVSRQALDAATTNEKPGCGWLPDAWMPDAALRRALRSLSRADVPTLTGYGSTRGSLELRRLLLGRFSDEGIDVALDQLLLTGSGTQAVDLICRYMLHPGDVVLVDDPGYFNFQALLKAHRVEIIGVPWTPAGPDVGAFESAVATCRPRLYITNSALHNPTGATLVPAIAHRLLRVAAAHDVTIIEDDIFADFEPAPSVRLAVLDGLDHVIRIGSFSKTLTAAARCGYIACRADWAQGLVDLQVATSFGGPSPLATTLIIDVLASGNYRKHMTGLRDRLTDAREQSAERLTSLGMAVWTMPRGGFYLWCQLPEGLDSADLARRCMEADIVLAPGNVFSVSQSAASFMRLNVAQMMEERTFGVIEAAMHRP